MSTISSYFTNVGKCSEPERTKRRLSNEGPDGNKCKKTALSIDGKCSVDIKQNSEETKTTTLTSNLDDCSDEETFLNNLEQLSKHTLDFSFIADLCSSKEFSKLQPSTTQAVSNLTSQPYIGLIEQKKLMLLLNFLLKLYESKCAFTKFQERSKLWAVTQLKKAFCLPTSVLYEKEHLYPITLQTAITKMVAVIAGEKCKKQKIPDKIIHILGLAALIALKMPVLPSPSFIESILQILYENNSTLPILQELLDLLTKLIIEDKIAIDSKSLGHLWILHPSSLEDIVVDIIVESKTQSNRRMTKSKLVEACCHNSLLFQNVVNMIVTAWLQTGGDVGIADTLSKFVCLVQNVCANSSLLSLFPDNLWPLVLLLQIPVTDLSPTMQNLHAFSIIEALSETVASGLCQIKDVVILFLIFSSWYQVLHNLSTVEHFNTSNELKLLLHPN